MRLALMLLLALPLHAQIDESRLLWAIGQIESGGNPSAVGQAGETLPQQMTPAMRRHYGTPLAMLRDLERQLPAAGMPVSEYTLALAWHCGMRRVARRCLTKADADYAERVREFIKANKEVSHGRAKP